MDSGRRPLASAEEVSEFAGLSVNTLYDQRKRAVGLGSLSIKIGRHLRWRWEDVDRWLDEQR